MTILPRASIVMPNYNHGHFIEAALGRALTQTMPAHEVIVIDDASTDDSVARITALARSHPSLRVVRHDRNQGVVASMNEGLGLASGDYVLFSAADDQLDLHMVERSMTAAALYPGAGITFSDPAEMNDDTGAITLHRFHLSQTAVVFSSGQWARLLRRAMLYMSIGNVFFNRQALLELPFDPDLRWHADYFSAYTLAFRHGACYAPEALSYFRRVAGSFSSQAETWDMQSGVLSRWFEKLNEPAFNDVRPLFRHSAVMPRYCVRALPIAARHGFLTPTLAVRTLSQRAWAWGRDLTPAPLRDKARRWRGKIARTIT